MKDCKTHGALYHGNSIYFLRRTSHYVIASQRRSVGAAIRFSLRPVTISEMFSASGGRIATSPVCALVPRNDRFRVNAVAVKGGAEMLDSALSFVVS